MEMHTEIIVEASAEDAWRVMGEGFGAIGDWLTLLEWSSLEGEIAVGAVRTCGLGGSKVATEVVTTFDPEAMRFSYRATSGLPWFMTHAENHWAIEALGPQRAVVKSHATMKLSPWLAWLGPLMRLTYKPMMKRVSEEIRHIIETGEPHPRKLAALAKRSAQRAVA